MMDRFSSLDVLGGFTVYVNMTLQDIKNILEQAIYNKPELSVQLDQIMTLIDTTLIADKVLSESLQALEELKTQLKQAKRTLELANTALSLTSKTVIGLMDKIPVVNGKPLGTGAMETIAPVQTTLDNGTTALQSLEDTIQEKTLELINEADKVKDKIEDTKQQVMDKLKTLI